MQNHHIPDPSGGSKKSSKLNKYEFSKANYVQQTDILRERTGRKYIYIIFINSHSQKGGTTPYYVGQASSLAAHLLDHDEISWHYDEFQFPASVHVIASVPDFMASQAETEAINLLLNRGYILNNSFVDELRLMMLKDMDRNERQRYLNAGKAPESLIPHFRNMNKLWLQKESNVKAEDSASHAGKKEITSRLLHKLVSERFYSDMRSKSLSRQLAKKYDPKTQCSIHTFSLPEDETKHDKRIKFITSIIKGLKGDWYLKEENLAAGIPLTFSPSESLLTSKPTAGAATEVNLKEEGRRKRY